MSRLFQLNRIGRESLGAHVVCPECFAKTKGEEKCCGHGHSYPVVCEECGKGRAATDGPWHCLGTKKAEDAR